MTNRTRTQDLVVEPAGDELVVYDLRTDAAHHLDAEVAAVFKQLDGTKSLPEVASALSLAQDRVEAIVLRLEDIDLTESSGATRRESLQKMAVAGVGVAAIVAGVRTIAAPDAAQAATGLPLNANCTSGAQCASGNCSGSVAAPGTCIPGM
jgi:predicted transcriptional regulator